MKKARTIRQLFAGERTVEGAGVKLTRLFGSDEIPRFDPFLLCDDFTSAQTNDFIKGFPWHPHRGIETVTYVIDGSVEHADSLGNQGTVHAGDVQWMTSGSGIIHQEMPLGNRHHRIEGFQLWINIPADEKMIDPGYQSIAEARIPVVHLSDRSSCRVIAGSFDTVHGPVANRFIDPVFFDVALSSDSEFVYPTHAGYTFLAYLIDGNASFGLFTESDAVSPGAYQIKTETAPSLPFVKSRQLLFFSDGDFIAVSTHHHTARFLLIGGRPIKEPVAWYGPIVMNTEEQLQHAFEEFQLGTFLKHGKKPVMQPAR